MAKRFGAIEAGGTKFVCAVGSGPGEVDAETRFPTGNPAETILRSIAFFQQETDRLGPLDALGIGSFGPIDLHRDSVTYGHVTSTPKPGWKDTDLVGPLEEALKIPVVFDTDVNAAAYAEGRWGAAKGLETFVYLTIGTGIGGGVVADGKMLHGMLHPEIGHLLIPHDMEKDPFEGTCPFHGDCFEGLAAGPAIGRRWQQDASLLPEDHEAWDLEAHYLALGLMNLILTLSPQRIVLGGGVMEQSHLFPKIRAKVVQQLAGYVQTAEICENIDAYIVPPALGNQAGLLGCFAMAMGEA